LPGLGNDLVLPLSIKFWFFGWHVGSPQFAGVMNL
jgi:hypothetical protein